MTDTSGPAGFPAGAATSTPASASAPEDAAPGDAAPGDAASGDAASPMPAADSAPDKDTAIEDLEQELGVLWRRARASSHRIAREVHPEMEPSAYGLMVLLHQQGAMRLTDLAAAVGVGKPSLSRQIGMLQALGLVEKHTDPVDGRAQPINLTAVGTARLEGTAHARKERSRQTWTGWEPEELQTLVRLLHKLNASVRPAGNVPEEEPSGADAGEADAGGSETAGADTAGPEAADHNGAPVETSPETESGVTGPG